MPLAPMAIGPEDTHEWVFHTTGTTVHARLVSVTEPVGMSRAMRKRLNVELNEMQMEGILVAASELPDRAVMVVPRKNGPPWCWVDHRQLKPPVPTSTGGAKN